MSPMSMSFSLLRTSFLGLAAAAFLAPQAQACSGANQIWPYTYTGSSWRVLANEVATNSNPAGCNASLPFDIDPGGTLQNRTGGSITNELGDYGGINGRGGLYVEGLLDNQANASITNDGDWYVAYGSLRAGEMRNAGLFTNRALFGNLGLFRNTSRVDNLSTDFTNDGNFINDGTVNNSGHIDARGGRFTNTAAGIINNRGQFAVSEVGLFVNVGTINNAVNGSLVLPSTNGLDMTGGTLNNHGSLHTGYLRLGDPLLGTVNLLADGRFEGGFGVLPGYSQLNSGRVHNTGEALIAGTLVNAGELQSSSALNIGYPGSTSGTVVNSGSIIVDAQSTFANNDVLLNKSSGTLRVTSGATLVNGGLQQGALFGVLTNEAGATITIESGASFKQSGELHSDGDVVNNGSAVFEASSETTGNGSFIQSSGQTVVDGVFGMSTFVLNGGTLCGVGNMAAAGTTAGSGGTICPGSPQFLRSIQRAGPLTAGIGQAEIGRFDFDGYLAFTGGTLRLEIAGAQLGQFDILNLAGGASFDGGLLELVFVDGYVPEPGTTFGVLLLQSNVVGLDSLSVRTEGLPEGSTLVFDPATGGVFVSAVPEPAAAASLLAGLAGLGFWRWLASTRRSRRRVCPSSAPAYA